VLTVLAGSSEAFGNQDGGMGVSRLSLELGSMATTPTGDVVIADVNNNRIRKLSPAGMLTTLAGGGPTVYDLSFPRTTHHADGQGKDARFHEPLAVAADAAGNTYVADTNNHVVRKIDAAGNVTTLAGQPGVCGNGDGSGPAATFCRPSSIAADASGNVYVAEISYSGQESTGNPIRKITSAGAVSTLTARASQLATRSSVGGGIPPGPIRYVYTYHPVRLAADASGKLYAADPNEHVIRAFDTTSGQASIVSGQVYQEGVTPTQYADGPGATARFGSTRAIARSSNGQLHVLDSGPDATGRFRNNIRRIDSDGSVTTVLQSAPCSSYGPNDLCSSYQLAVTPAGHYLVNEAGLLVEEATTQFSLIRKYMPDGSSTVVAGGANGAGGMDGMGSAARLNRPRALAMSRAGVLYVGDFGNNVIRSILPDAKVQTFGKARNYCDMVTGRIEAIGLCELNTLAVDGQENLYTPAGRRILKATPVGEVSVLADLTQLLSAAPPRRSQDITGLVADATGVVFAATTRGVVIKITPQGQASVFAGSLGNLGHADGPAGAARFSLLGNMTLDAQGHLYVIDGMYYEATGIGPTVRKIAPDGTVSTIAGRADAAPGLADGPATTTARLTVNPLSYLPYNTPSLAVDAKGNVYITDYVHSLVRKIGTDMQMSTLLGQPWTYGFAAEAPTLIDRPTGIAVRGSALYITTSNAIAWVKLP
jgi:hypothetical protein